MLRMEYGLHETLSYLQDLNNCETPPLNERELLDRLLHAVGQDGFNLNEDLPHRFLRGLAEAVGGVDLTDLILVVVCVIMAGLASGLTQGLLSLDLMEMEIKSRSGTDEEKSYAAKLIPIISHHHLLLVSLMLWNASATEALPVFLNRLVPEYMAIIISVTLVLFVGEIIPASILTGPRQLQITANLTPLVYLVLVIFFPVAYPIAYCLDYIIGTDNGMTMYNRQEISTMMRLQREEGVKRASEQVSHGGGVTSGSPLDAIFEEDEVIIIDGALKYREMFVEEVMTPAENAFMIPITEKLSYKTIYAIFKSGYSRIPVYDKGKDDIVGLILAKDLIFVDPEDETPVKNFLELFGRKPAVAWHDSKLGETLTMFRMEKSHMAIVRDVISEGNGDPYYIVVGIITLEDIVEEILGTEIEDETDVAEGTSSTAGTMNPLASAGFQAAAAAAEAGQEQQSLFAATRDAELARLRTIQGVTVLEHSLNDDQVDQIGIYLFTNVPQIQRLFKGNMQDLKNYIRNSVVIETVRKAAAGARPHHEDYLYRRGKMTNACVLILSGTVEVIEDERDMLKLLAELEGKRGQAGSNEDDDDADNDHTMGEWNTLGADALTSTEGHYIPDFSAFITSDTVRYLRLSNVAYKDPAMEEGDGWPAANKPVGGGGGVGGGGSKTSSTRSGRIVTRANSATPRMIASATGMNASTAPPPSASGGGGSASTGTGTGTGATTGGTGASRPPSAGRIQAAPGGGVVIQKRSGSGIRGTRAAGSGLLASFNRSYSSNRMRASPAAQRGSVGASVGASAGASAGADDAITAAGAGRERLTGKQREEDRVSRISALRSAHNSSFSLPPATPPPSSHRSPRNSDASLGRNDNLNNSLSHNAMEIPTTTTTTTTGTARNPLHGTGSNNNNNGNGSNGSNDSNIHGFAPALSVQSPLTLNQQDNAADYESMHSVDDLSPLIQPGGDGSSSSGGGGEDGKNHNEQGGGSNGGKS